MAYKDKPLPAGSKVSHVRMKIADNGFIVCADIQYPSPPPPMASLSPYDNPMIYDQCEYVFMDKDEKAAVAKMRELHSIK